MRVPGNCFVFIALPILQICTASASAIIVFCLHCGMLHCIYERSGVALYLQFRHCTLLVDDATVLDLVVKNGCGTLGSSIILLPKVP